MCLTCGCESSRDKRKLDPERPEEVRWNGVDLNIRVWGVSISTEVPSFHKTSLPDDFKTTVKRGLAATEKPMDKRIGFLNSIWGQGKKRPFQSLLKSRIYRKYFSNLESSKTLGFLL